MYQRIWWRIRYRLHRWFGSRRSRNFRLGAASLRQMEQLAEQRLCDPEDLADRLLEEQLRVHQKSWQAWESLAPRDKQVAALICLGYTSRMIAGRLGITPKSVKAHAEFILGKFGAPNRKVLRVLMQGWDFSKWEK